MRVDAINVSRVATLPEVLSGRFNRGHMAMTNVVRRMSVDTGGKLTKLNEKGDMQMSDAVKGAEALEALNRDDDSNGMEYTSLKSGDTLFVKVLGDSDLMSFFNYGIFKKVNSFVAENPSKKSAKGYPVENLTPWDKAWKYHKDLSEEFNDEHGQEAGKYRAKHRFAFGFFDLTSGEPIIIDLSKKQGQAIYKTIKKVADKGKLDKTAFELSKDGSGTNTTVSLTPVMDMEDDLTDEQRENFDKAPAEFDMKLFEGINYEASENEQIELLAQAGFDISLIGLTMPKKGDGDPGDQGEPIDIKDEDLPF